MSKINNLPLNILLSIFILLACSCKQHEVEYQLKEEVMADILFDIHVAEAAVQQDDVSIRDSIRLVYYNQIFELHGISLKEYEADMALLERDADRLTEVYDIVIEKLKKRKEKL